MEPTPEEPYEFRRAAGSVLVIACGALGRELVAIIEANRFRHIDVQCLPAIWHVYPQKIPEGVREKIRAARGKYDRIFVAYADCGTGGLLDKVLGEEGGVERIDGPHCYAFFAGNAAFAARAEEDDMTAFFLTDYLARQFDKLIWEGFGIDRHPELLPMYFANYTKVVYLSQIEDAGLLAKARAAADRLGLAFEHRPTGYGELATFLEKAAQAAPRNPVAST